MGVLILKEGAARRDKHNLARERREKKRKIGGGGGSDTSDIFMWLTSNIL